MKILVTAASRHGATQEVASFITDRLRQRGLSAVQMNPDEVDSVDDFDVVICGSAVYMTQWMPEANNFLERFNEGLARKLVWAFSVGLSGVPKHTPQDPSRIGPVLMKVPVIQHQMFAGRYKPSVLSLRERTIARLAGAIEDDFRSWDAIGAWADGIVDRLEQDEDERES